MRTRPKLQQSYMPTVGPMALTVLLATATAIAGLSCGGGGDVGPGPTLTISLAGTGRGTVLGANSQINCANADGATPGPVCEDEVAEGTQVTLAASPASGSTFTGWSGTDLNCPASAPCSITVTESRTITATFDAPQEQVLTVVGGGPGTGSGSVVSDPAGIDCTISAGQAGSTGCSAPFPTGTSVQLVETGDLLAWGGACDGSTCSTVMSVARTVVATFAADAEATQLTFVVQPSAVQVGGAITPAVQVAVQDEEGVTVGGRTDAITLEIANNPGTATLGGQLTRNAVNGVATFPDLTLNQISNGYTLSASASGLPDETSAAFDVTATPVAKLVFSVQPSDAVAGVDIAPAVQVEIQDQGGALLTTRTDNIAISLQNNPGGGTLGGTVVAPAVAGVATFSDLTLTVADSGYTLAVSTQAASGDISDPFDVVAGPARLAEKNSLDPQDAQVGTKVAVRPSVKVTDAFNNVVEGVPVKWEVTAGGGAVVASNEDPVNRNTGPLGLSTAVSWTLGPDVGSNNNTLRATITAPNLQGSPITFTASGTLPPNQGIFTGTIRGTNNAGQLLDPVTDAKLTFVRLTAPETELGTAETQGNGTFVSPPLPANVPYRLEIDSDAYKEIEYAKPVLPAGTSSVGVLGMVPNAEGGQSTVSFIVNLEPAPTDPITVRVEMYLGYYLPDSDSDEGESEAFEDFNVLSGEKIEDLDVRDWGVMTLRVSTPNHNYETVTQQVYLDQPNEDWPLEPITLQEQE